MGLEQEDEQYEEEREEEYEEGVDEEDDDEEVDMSFADVHEELLQQVRRSITITLGALIAYLNSDIFEELTDVQRDYVFEYVIDTWSLILPQPIDEMWDRQVVLLAFTQQLRAVAEQKARAPAEQKERDDRMRLIYKQLGWDFDAPAAKDEK